LIAFFNIKMNKQREMPFRHLLKTPQFAPRADVEKFQSYRDAVIWCWEHRVNVGAGEKLDQSICANALGLHAPHMNRCVKRDSDSPMNLPPDLIADFESFCGWRAISQYLASKAQITWMEEMQHIMQTMSQARAIA
jgi:hypothetical protein